GVVVIYLILDQMIQLGWSQLTTTGAVWLTVLFAFGTVYFWMSFHRGPSFLAQIVTILFCGLAFLVALKRGSAWISGLCLMAAVMCRPNVFVLWLALLAIAIQVSLKEGKLDWKPVIKWGVFSAIPGFVGSGALLYYNHLRFANYFDFGYVSINGAAFVVANVQAHGLFNTFF